VVGLIMWVPFPVIFLIVQIERAHFRRQTSETRNRTLRVRKGIDLVCHRTWFELGG
jgi:hypothetical protein